LLEQFSSLGTDDRDDLIKAFQRVVGHEVTTECSRFFLELANWNLQKGIGAYFDYSFEAAPGTSVQTSIIRPINIDESGSQSARVYHSPNSDFKKTPTLIWCVQNSGPSAWPTGSYIAAEVSRCELYFFTHGDLWLRVQERIHGSPAPNKLQNLRKLIDAPCSASF
uniref:VASt domain-containing protein n=1 Tax=Schistocephalus solidus TaxID=70667 RepID=A0A183SYW8_SCHSO